MKRPNEFMTNLQSNPNRTGSVLAVSWAGVLCSLVIGCTSSGNEAESTSGGKTSAGAPAQAGSNGSAAGRAGVPNGGSGGTGESGSMGGGTQSSGGTGGSLESAGAGAAPVTGGTGGTSVAGGGGASSGGGSAGALAGPWPPSATFSNPSLWQDVPDPEVIRVDDVYYYTGSNMHYSPGAPILRSWDLVNWEYAGHAVPKFDMSPKYNLEGGQAYIKGDWASSLHYRKANKTFYWVGCIEFSKTYVYTASSVEGPWKKTSTLNNCYYDCGVMVDYDDSADDAGESMYIAYGNPSINVAKLKVAADGTVSQVSTKQVFSKAGTTLEGSHFFRYKGSYYITPTRPADGEFVLKSDSPTGTYTSQALIDRNSGPIASGGAPHQGSLVQTQAGDWYYMAFQDAFPGGRIPVLAPVKWSADGWPSVVLNANAWAGSYPYPSVSRPPRATKPHTGTDSFTGTSLAPEWEWNHNPDDSKWSIDNGVTLQTATVTADLYAARNTLTRRFIGPQSTATIEVDLSKMSDGDVAGLSLLRDKSAYVAVKKSSGSLKVVMVSGLTMITSNWNTSSTGTEAASSPLSGTTIWLRASMDGRPGASRQGKFFYSTDGQSFSAIGSPYTLNNDWPFYPGYRFGIFNFATAALGGSIKVKSFTLTTP